MTTRRTTLKWVAAASLTAIANPGRPLRAKLRTARGDGTDPNLLQVYKPGDLWELTLTAEQRLTAAALADVIIPADDGSPSASAVGVVAFLDEWVSAPYPRHRNDRGVLVEGLAWMNAEGMRRFGRDFAALDAVDQHSICDAICNVHETAPEFAAAAKFFALFRDLTVGGFYTTPEGRKDLQYIGNVPLARFDGPPATLLASLGLAATATANESGAAVSPSAGSRGWLSLLDEGSADAWHGWGLDALPGGWTVKHGTLSKSGLVADLVTRKQYANFVLEFEWNVGTGGNSGVFYRVSPEYGNVYNPGSDSKWSAPEYQLLDDANNPEDGGNRLTAAASVFGLYAAPAGFLRSHDHWNRTRIVVDGAHVEHWLNGHRMLVYELWSSDWKARVAASKFAGDAHFGIAARGFIGIQGDHEGKISFRHMRIRELP